MYFPILNTNYVSICSFCCNMFTECGPFWCCLQLTVGLFIHDLKVSFFHSLCYLFVVGFLGSLMYFLYKTALTQTSAVLQEPAFFFFFFRIDIYLVGARVACWLEHRTRDWKVASSNPSRSSKKIFFSRVNFMCWLIRSPFHPRVTVVACTRPRSFCQKCRWQVTPKHAYTLTQQSQSGLTMLLSRHSVGTYQEMSSHVTCQGILSHSHLGSLSHCRLILAWRVELMCAS